MIESLFARFMIPVLAAMPVPRDLDLPLPLDLGVLKFLLVVLFLVHILFVNLMVGASVLTVIFEIMGRYNAKFDVLAKKIAETISVNKSLAVVFGVGPLLCINLAYTIQFYSANAITGHAWMSIVPSVILAFLLTYLHKYTWERWTGAKKNLHIMVGGIAAFLFLSIPFFFLANINLMLLPEKWHEVVGFFTALQVGNVFPRYFHFLSASLALTGLFLAGWFGRKRYPVEEMLPEFTRGQLRRLFYKFAFYVTVAQLAFGPLLLFTLPLKGLTGELFMIILSGVAIALFVLFLLNREIKASEERIGKRYIVVVLLFAVVVGFMGTGRHVYREASLVEHNALIAAETARFKAIELGTEMRLAAGLDAGEAIGGPPTGKQIFMNCAACHAVDKVLAAPSLHEVYAIYKGNPEGIVTWAKAPGKKRAAFAPMPSFQHLGDEKLKLVADYILEIGKPGAEQSSGTL